VVPVGLDIDDVVEDINHTGKQAKDGKASYRMQDSWQVAGCELPVEDQGSKEQDVLRPLAGAQGKDQGFQGSSRHGAMIVGKTCFVNLELCWVAGKRANAYSLTR
jgi:hypothetical protein